MVKEEIFYSLLNDRMFKRQFFVFVMGCMLIEASVQLQILELLAVVIIACRISCLPVCYPKM
jgi:hypothetical protein